MLDGTHTHVVLFENELLFSGNVLIKASIFCVSLHVLTVDQRLDALLDHGWIRVELLREYLGGFCDQGIVLDLPPGLHDFNDRRLNHVLAVLVHLLGNLRLLRLLVLFGMSKRHLDLVHMVLEGGVDRVDVTHGELFDALLRVAWVLLQHDLQLKQGNHVALHVKVAKLGHLQQLLVSELLVLVEQEQDAHLEGGCLQLMLGITWLGDDVSEAKGRFPVKCPPCVLVLVELVEVLHAKLDLAG